MSVSQSINTVILFVVVAVMAIVNARMTEELIVLLLAQFGLLLASAVSHVCTFLSCCRLEVIAVEKKPQIFGAIAAQTVVCVSLMFYAMSYGIIEDAPISQELVIIMFCYSGHLFSYFVAIAALQLACCKKKGLDEENIINSIL